MLVMEETAEGLVQSLGLVNHKTRNDIDFPVVGKSIGICGQRKCHEKLYNQNHRSYYVRELGNVRLTGRYYTGKTVNLINISLVTL